MMRFIRLFSSSRALSFLASFTSISPNFRFQSDIVCELTLCSAQISLRLFPARSCSRIRTFCSSVNRLLFISAWVLPRRSLLITCPVFRGQANGSIFWEHVKNSWVLTKKLCAKLFINHFSDRDPSEPRLIKWIHSSP